MLETAKVKSVLSVTAELGDCAFLHLKKKRITPRQFQRIIVIGLEWRKIIAFLQIFNEPSLFMHYVMRHPIWLPHDFNY